MALKTSLVALWELSEASGTRNDSHSTNHLTPSGTPGNTAGKYSSNALRLVSASSQYLNIADNAALSMNNETFSVAGWVRMTFDNTEAWILSKWSGSSREYILTWDRLSKKFGFSVSNDGTSYTDVEATTFGTPATDGSQWCWIYAYHEQGVGLGISVDNGTINTATHTGGVYSGTEEFRVGSHPGGFFFIDADIQQLGIWRKLLDAGDRTAIYNGGTGLAYSAWDVSTGHPASRRMGGVLFAGNQSLGINRW